MDDAPPATPAPPLPSCLPEPRWLNAEILPVDWGMMLSQFTDFLAACRGTACWTQAKHAFGVPSLYVVVDGLVKPWTRNTGCSVALRMNPASALRAELMVSHSWGESMDECAEALQKFYKRSLLLWYELHQRVPPDRWCVTLSDLRYLRKTVLQSIKAGSVEPPADGSDDFSSEDEVFGPSIYTITEQHIKPVTELAGKMSWALMRNPEGLDCDLFISHAWQEGIFEFMSKVLHSWPRGMRHAWCCMLANPQHLDIAAMLQSPRQSPFAVALAASQIVLAVPNRHCSIYTRLWCAYEAYLAQEQDKIILIARASNSKDILNSIWKMLLVAVIGVMLGVAIDVGTKTLPVNLVVVGVAAVAAALSMGSGRDNLRKWLNLLGQAMCCFLIFDWYTVHGLWEQQDADLYRFAAIQQRLYLITFAGAFCYLEVDRLNDIAARREAEQLGAGYQGSIVHATCSRQADSEEIRREIGDNVDAVDYAIKVLLAAGMSSPTLRHVALKGINIDQVANPQVTVSFLVLVPLNLIRLVALLCDVFYLGRRVPDFGAILPIESPYPPLDHHRMRGTRRLLEAVSVLLRCCMLVLMFRRARDERCFIHLVIQKVAMIYLAGLIPNLMRWELDAKSETAPSLRQGFLLAQLITYTPCFFFALLGIRGTAEIPWCGLCILRVLMSRTFRSCRATAGDACHRPGEVEDSEGDTSEWSSTS
ncbi:unnamed protein product [Symbiodinium natans]|uniref:Uncharacterized protein n=1 Tax=Symbiodinium natans TaxID=878477 RepID=A0A812U0S3_9DINO|nr:unnamed protein product [Symbiodinium natans]